MGHWGSVENSFNIIAIFTKVLVDNLNNDHTSAPNNNDHNNDNDSDNQNHNHNNNNLGFYRSLDDHHDNKYCNNFNNKYICVSIKSVSLTNTTVILVTNTVTASSSNNKHVHFYNYHHKAASLYKVFEQI